MIRHGQSQNNALFSAGPRSATGSDRGRVEDPELTALGRRQARRLADCLADGAGPDKQNPGAGSPSHLYTSLMVRSVATAATVAQATGLTPVACTDLHEVGGVYLQDDNTDELKGRPGKPRSYFAEHFPELVLPPRTGIGCTLNNTAVSRLDFRTDWVEIAYLNRVDFLTPDMIT